MHHSGVFPLPLKQMHHSGVFRPPQDDTCILTASGDQAIGLWHCGNATAYARFQGHSASVKALGQHPDNPFIFASGMGLRVWGLCKGGTVYVGYTVSLSSTNDRTRCVLSSVKRVSSCIKLHTV